MAVDRQFEKQISELLPGVPHVVEEKEDEELIELDEEETLAETLAEEVERELSRKGSQPRTSKPRRAKRGGR